MFKSFFLCWLHSQEKILLLSFLKNKVLTTGELGGLWKKRGGLLQLPFVCVHFVPPVQTITQALIRWDIHLPRELSFYPLQRICCRFYRRVMRRENYPVVEVSLVFKELSSNPFAISSPFPWAQRGSELPALSHVSFLPWTVGWLLTLAELI